MFLTAKSSIAIKLLALTKLVVNLCKKSVRASLILACIRATLSLALSRLLEPLVFRLSSFCAAPSFLYSRLKCFGLDIFSPSLVLIRLVTPASIPTCFFVGGNVSTVWSSINRETNHLPDGSSLTVTVEGLHPSGRSLDQTIGNGSLDLASQRQPSRYLKADLVNSAEPPLRLALNLGYLALLPQKLAKAAWCAFPCA